MTGLDLCDVFQVFEECENIPPPICSLKIKCTQLLEWSRYKKPITQNYQQMLLKVTDKTMKTDNMIADLCKEYMFNAS